MWLIEFRIQRGQGSIFLFRKSGGIWLFAFFFLVCVCVCFVLRPDTRVRLITVCCKSGGICYAFEAEFVFLRVFCLLCPSVTFWCELIQWNTGGEKMYRGWKGYLRLMYRVGLTYLLWGVRGGSQCPQLKLVCTENGLYLWVLREWIIIPGSKFAAD